MKTSLLLSKNDLPVVRKSTLQYFRTSGQTGLKKTGCKKPKIWVPKAFLHPVSAVSANLEQEAGIDRQIHGALRLFQP